MNYKEEALEAFEAASEGKFTLNLTVGKWSGVGSKVKIEDGCRCISMEGATPITSVVLAYRAWKAIREEY